MANLHQTSGILGDPRKILLELADLHQLSELLPLAVRRLAESPAVALARIWLIHPPKIGDCAACRFTSECPQRKHCLHLVASAGRSIQQPDDNWQRLEGSFRRFPIGVRKVGQIAATGESLEVADVEGDHPWAADPNWIRAEQIRSFVGHPLMHRGEVLGVLALFSRAQPGPTCFEWLRMIANHLAAEGKGFHSGQIVLTGSLVKTVWLNAGDAVVMELDGLGTVTADFHN